MSTLKTLFTINQQLKERDASEVLAFRKQEAKYAHIDTQQSQLLRVLFHDAANLRDEGKRYIFSLPHTISAARQAIDLLSDIEKVSSFLDRFEPNEDILDQIDENEQRRIAEFHQIILQTKLTKILLEGVAASPDLEREGYYYGTSTFHGKYTDYVHDLKLLRRDDLVEVISGEKDPPELQHIENYAIDVSPF